MSDSLLGRWSLLPQQTEKQAYKHTERTLGCERITVAHLLHTAFICWRAEPRGWVGQRGAGGDGDPSGSNPLSPSEAGDEEKCFHQLMKPEELLTRTKSSALLLFIFNTRSALIGLQCFNLLFSILKYFPA